MSKKIRLGYDILSKRAIETESGVNIDEAIKGKISVQKVAGTGADSHPDVARPNTEVIYLVRSVSSGATETYKQWMWIQPVDAAGYWECIADNTDLSVIERDIDNLYSNFDYIYLDPDTGNDTHDGTSENTAVKTLAGAVAAFNAAKEASHRFTVLKVVVMSDHQAIPLALPTEAEMETISDYHDGLHIYGTGVSLSNTINNNPEIIQYPLHVVADDVTIYLSHATDISDSYIQVKCKTFAGNCYTTSTIDINASESINLGASGSDSVHNTAPLFLRSGGTIQLSGAPSYYSTVNICADGDITIGQQLNADTGAQLIRSVEGSVYFTLPLTAYDSNTSSYLDVVIDACFGVQNSVGISCNNLTINAGKKIAKEPSDNDVVLGGGNYIYGKTAVKCTNFVPHGGSHQYYGNVSIDADVINLSGAGSFSLHENGDFIARSYFAGAPTIYANNLYVHTTGAEPVVSGSPCDSYVYTLVPYRDSNGVTNTNSTYTFDMGNSALHTKYSGIQNQFADVIIISNSKVHLAEDGGQQYSKSLTIKVKDLKLYTAIHTGYFDIDVDNMIEQYTPGSYLLMDLAYNGQSESETISYDTPSNNRLKCGSLYCSNYYTSDSYGLIQPYYGSAIKNIDIQVGMILSSSYNGNGIHTPFVLGTCRSGVHTFNSTISGHVGGYVGYSSSLKVSPWDHDVRYIPSSYGSIIVDGNPSASGNTGGVITLKFDDVYETNHFWFDPDQGDDTLDGCTRQTAVKTVTALVYAIMKKTNGSYYSTGNYFNINAPVTIHILSVSSGSNREVKWFSGVTDVYDLSDWMYNNGSQRGLCFDYVAGHGGCRVQFNMLEFVPEAPDMSLYVKAFNANVLIAKGFYNIGLCGYGSSGINYLEASGSVGIYNNTSYGGYSYYSNRLGPLSIRARDIVLFGWFNNLYAKAENNLYICDSTGNYPDTDGNCCLYGMSNLEAAYVYLGYEYTYNNVSYQNKIGISGKAYIKASSGIITLVDSMLGVVFMEAAEDISGGFGDGYFRGQLHVKCTNCAFGYSTSSSNSYYSFNTYSAASSGGAGIIDIQASKQITVNGWGAASGTDSYLYGTDLYLSAPYIGGSKLTLYGNNGSGIIFIDAPCQLSLSILPYYYALFRVIAGTLTAPIGTYSGGPFSPSSSTLLSIKLDIHELQQPIRLYTAPMSSYNSYSVKGRIDCATCEILNWGQVIDPDNPPSITPGCSYNFALVVGHSTETGHGIAKTGWIPDNSGSIIVLNDEKQLVAGAGITMTDSGDNVVLAARNDMPLSTVTVPVIIDANDSTQGTATLVLNKYNIITGLDDTITDMDIVIPAPSANFLREVGFEFEPVEGTQLENVTFSDTSNTQFLPVVPEEYAYGCVYQGAAINRCVTLVEYGEPIEPEELVIDGKTYRTVVMPDGKTWTAENIAADSLGGVWYNDNKSIYEKYGKFYNPTEIEAISIPGWHVATWDDWSGLKTVLNNDINKLKSTTDWEDGYPGTDDYGFTLLPCGQGYAYPYDLSDVEFVAVGNVAGSNVSSSPEPGKCGYTYGFETYWYMDSYDPTSYIMVLPIRLVKDNE